MDVLRIHGRGDVRVETAPEPVPGPGEELVRMTAVGLCGSNLHWFEDGGIGGDDIVEPMLLGHEMGGVIAAGPREGTHVVVEPAIPCGRCRICVAGHANLCEDVRFAGHYPVDGGMATYMAWPSHLLFTAPDSIAGDDIALVEPLGVALHVLDLGRVRAGMTIGVYGCGPIGQFIIRAARARGVARIQATDPLPHRRDAAVASGADEVRDIGPDGLPAEGASWTPVDVAFEVAGNDAGVATAVGAARSGGRVVFVGIPSDDRHTIPAGVARRKGLTIAVAHRMQLRHLHAAMELLHHGVVDPSGIITARFPLSAGPAAFEALAARGGLKIILNP